MCVCKGVEGLGGIGATQRITSEGFRRATRRVASEWVGKATN